MNILSQLKTHFHTALKTLVDDPTDLLELIRPAGDARFGDYQANCAMPLGKKLGRPPQELAQQIVDALDVSELCDQVDIAGPGFINLRLRDDWLVGQLREAITDERLGVAAAEPKKTYIVDYSSPNVAKPMHVGHIRSTVIGDSLCRTLKFLGHTAISDNHLGDWGTQFGMIIYGFRYFGEQTAYEIAPVAELARVYKLVRRIMDHQSAITSVPTLKEKVATLTAEVKIQQAAAPSGDAKADKKAAKALRRLESQQREATTQLDSVQASIGANRSDGPFAALSEQHAGIGRAVLQETVKLHEGDAENLRLWEEFLPACRREIERIYGRLSVTFDEELGESFYHDRLAAVVEDFLGRGLARESDGAICLFLDGYKAPMIVRKQDGAFLYATTDLATIAYRVERWNPDAVLYVVDHRQGEHFGKLFAAARLWGHEKLELRHVSFGTVLGDDGRPFKTRAGDTVGLEGLLDEAVRRALAVVSDNDDGKPNGPELSAGERQHVAETVGIAALKYADLSQNRESDYTFSYDKMLALSGNTATYMQYAYARVRNIFARGDIDISALRSSGAKITLAEAGERDLALAILRFSEALELVTSDYRPNHLTNYLFELADKYSSFYVNCPVLKADDPKLRDSRLLLCDLTARVLKQGLDLLGIQVVEKM